MKRAASQPQDEQRPAYVGPARVLEVDEENGRIRVLVNPAAETAGGPGDAWNVWARQALPYPCELGWGDTVLVAGDPGQGLFVVGILNAQARARAWARKGDLVLESGARAEVDGPPEAERLRVFSASGEMIFEHDPATGRSRVGVQSGDLEIVTPNGNIDFISARGVRFFSRDAIEMRSLRGIEMAVADTESEAVSSLDLQPGRVDLRGTLLGLSARKGELRIDEAEVTGKRLSGAIANVSLAMDRCETLVGTVIEKARSVYRTVAELAQIKAGRMRTLVDETYQLQSRTAFLKAEKDFKVDGEKIHLG